MALGDLEGDGDLEAVVAPESSFQVWFGEPGAGFTAGVLINTPTGGVALGDLDGDGDLDVFTYGGGVFRNDGSGDFVDSGQSLDATCAALGDLDADGDLDAFVGTSGGNDVVLTVPNGSACAELHADAPGLRSGMQPLDPGPYRAYCDMDTDGGGWTLLLSEGPSFDRTAVGDVVADCYGAAPCTNRAYGQVVLGDDLRIDASDVAIATNTYTVRTIVTGIDPAFAGETLRARLLDTATRYYVELDSNANVTNQFIAGTCGTLPFGDYDQIICGTEVLAVNDPSLSPCIPIAVFAFGTEFDRDTEFMNCAGWPDAPNYAGANYWPDFLRTWTR